MLSLETLIRAVADPATEGAYAAAWALDFGTASDQRVRVVADGSELPPRPPGMDELFLWFGMPRSGEWEPLLPHLDEAERSQIARLRQPADRWSAAAAHAGARALLARALGCLPGEIAFTRSTRGKPTLDPARHGGCVNFNISHTRGLVAVALAGCPVGVDVECVRDLPDMDAVAETVFSAEAFLALAGTADGAARRALFFRFWTLGEAFIKATGEGLSQGLKTFAFNADRLPCLTRVSDAWSPRTRWRFGTFPT